MFDEIVAKTTQYNISYMPPVIIQYSAYNKNLF